MKAKSSRKRKLIVAGALLGAAVILASAALVGSGAVFTTTSANPKNVFTSGILSMWVTRDGSSDLQNQAILTAELMKPGDVSTGRVVIFNTGDIPGDFRVDMENVKDVAGSNGGYLGKVLQLKIMDVREEKTVYEGPLSAFEGANLGTFLPGDLNRGHVYEFTVTFPEGGTPLDNASGDNSYQGSMTEKAFIWTAVQTEDAK